MNEMPINDPQLHYCDFCGETARDKSFWESVEIISDSHRLIPAELRAMAGVPRGTFNAHLLPDKENSPMERTGYEKLSEYNLNLIARGANATVWTQHIAKELLELRAKVKELELLEDAASELLECARLRGDNELQSPERDPQLWTARMQTAWDEFEAALEDSSETPE